MALAAAALLAFGRYSWLLYHYQNFESRRRLTGCETARQVLDLMGHSHLTVEAVKLEKKAYEGTSLLAAASSAHEAVALAKLSDAWRISDAVRQVRRVLNFLIIPAWIAVFAGFQIGWWVLGAVFIFGILDFGRDIDLQRETLELLKKTGCFEPDEMIKLRRLLQALQLEGLANIFKVPYELVANWSPKRKNHDV